MPANLENSAVATGLEKVRFHSNLKEGQCQRMFKLIHNCAHLICQQSKSQNSPSQVSTVREPRKFKLDLEKAEEPEIELPTSAGLSKKRVPEKKIYFCFIDYTESFDCVDHNKLENS